MNERIQELVEQCTEYWNVRGAITEKFDKEKFATLIVQECAALAFHNVVNISGYADAEAVEQNIIDQMGVEP